MFKYLLFAVAVLFYFKLYLWPMISRSTAPMPSLERSRINLFNFICVSKWETPEANIIYIKYEIYRKIGPKKRTKITTSSCKGTLYVTKDFVLNCKNWLHLLLKSFIWTCCTVVMKTINLSYCTRNTVRMTQ